MHIVEMDASTEDLRVAAMHLRSPIHTLMFNGYGTLLGANASALQSCHVHTPGDALSLHLLPGQNAYVSTYIKC